MEEVESSRACGLHLDAMEREQISIGLAQGLSGRAIGRRLKRAASTITREKLRHQVPAHKEGGRPLYRGYWAQQQADATKRRCGRKRKLDLAGVAGSCALSDHVRDHLLAGWSPKAIACRLKRDYPNETNWHLSAMTIYDAVYILPRNQLKAQLVAEGLHQGQEKRHPRQAKGSPPARVRIVGGVSIHERSPEVEARLLPGHWEGDLIIGQGSHSQVGTILERVSRKVVLARTPDKQAATVREAFARALGTVPGALRKTLTYDQGSEMAQHALLTEQLQIAVYFADAHSPWQKGAIEHANGLLRQYLPRSTDLSKFSQVQLDDIAQRINERPREILNWQTPNEVYATMLANVAVKV
jgi:transposase, IS30 family